MAWKPQKLASWPREVENLSESLSGGLLRLHVDVDFDFLFAITEEQHFRTQPESFKPSRFAASCQHFRCSAVTRRVRIIPMNYALRQFRGKCLVALA